MSISHLVSVNFAICSVVCVAVLVLDNEANTSAYMRTDIQINICIYLLTYIHVFEHKILIVVGGHVVRATSLTAECNKIYTNQQI